LWGGLNFGPCQFILTNLTSNLHEAQNKFYLFIEKKNNTKENGT